MASSSATNKNVD